MSTIRPDDLERYIEEQGGKVIKDEPKHSSLEKILEQTNAVLQKPSVNVKVKVFASGKPAFRALVTVNKETYHTNQDGIVMVHVPNGDHMITADLYDDYGPSKVQVTMPGTTEVTINIPS